MHHLSEILAANVGLLRDMSSEDQAIYTTVLNREQALGVLDQAQTLKLFGDGSPDQMCILADETQTRLLVLNPSAEELATILARIGSSIRVLELFRTGVVQMELPALAGLTELKLSENPLLERICAPEGLPALEHLDLSNTAVSTADAFPLPGTLKELFLYNTRLDAIPDGIRELTQLEQLNLSNLHLAQIPDWFPDFHLVDVPNAIWLHDTLVRGERIKVTVRYGQELRTMLRRLCGHSMREFKVILLGDAEAGKTLTLRRLMEDDKKPFEDEINDPYLDKETYAPAGFDHNSTPGVIIEEREYNLNRYGLGDEKIRVHFWDFGGQEILHSAHRAFLTDRTLYVILLNTRNNTQDAQARYWLRYLRAEQPNCSVILVLNKIDQNPNATVDINRLRRIYGRTLNAHSLSSLKYNRRLFAEEFTKKLLYTLITTENLVFTIPARYNGLREWLKNHKKDPKKTFVEENEFEDACEACDYAISQRIAAGDVPADEGSLDPETLLQRFSALGLCVYFKESSSYVILRPEWITNAIYAILINKHSKVTNGLISRTELREVLYPTGKNRQKIKMTNPDEKYESMRPDYILNVMHRAGLSIPVEGSDQVFIPMLCERNTPDDLQEYLEDASVMRFRYILDDLPNSKLFELLIQLFKDANSSDIWLTGGLFRWTANECSAVVLVEDHRIDIYMRPKGERKKALVQLGKLNETIEKIIGKDNLMSLIGLRVGAQTEFFDKNLLDNNLEYDIDKVYSQFKSGLVYIEDITNYRDNTNERLRIALLQNIVGACRQMQRNPHYYQCSEDTRNLYISDALNNMGYKATPKFPLSLGQGLSRLGEIDVVIDSTRNTAISLCEALNLRSKSQKKYWLQHLEKLVGRYNQAGYSCLFLVNYVEDPGERFDDVVKKYYTHICNCYPMGYGLKEPARYVRLEMLSNLNNIRVVESLYCIHGGDILVYHIFTRFWHPTKKRTVRKPKMPLMPKTLVWQSPSSWSAGGGFSC